VIALGANINVRDYLLDTPLHRCASKGLPECCILLLESGALCNKKDRYRKKPLDFGKYV